MMHNTISQMGMTKNFFNYLIDQSKFKVLEKTLVDLLVKPDPTLLLWDLLQ
jgi:hypothetical protein